MLVSKALISNEGCADEYNDALLSLPMFSFGPFSSSSSAKPTVVCRRVWDWLHRADLSARIGREGEGPFLDGSLVVKPLFRARGVCIVGTLNDFLCFGLLGVGPLLEESLELNDVLARLSIAESECVRSRSPVLFNRSEDTILETCRRGAASCDAGCL